MQGTKWLVVVVVVASLGGALGQDDTPQVTLEQGVIQGILMPGGDDPDFYAFRSIPFAEPPVGELRFKEPVPASGWEGVRDGSQLPPMCPQIPITSFIAGKSDVGGDEDCLYLNVYTPNLDGSRAVMVYIHGGAFVLGSAGDQEPLPTLLTNDVVVVVIQYRLNTLGFLSTGDGSIPGNLGLRDQLAALRWVQDNIQNFGGDPAKVTIFGESAGGASVHYQVMSPLAKGLFQRAIMQSGVALGSWAINRNPAQVATRVGQLLECPDLEDTQALANCLREKPFEDLVKAQSNFTVWMTSPTVMVPSVDGDFLPDAPEVLLREGRYNSVDIISGFCRDDGAISAKIFFSDPRLPEMFLQNFAMFGPVSFGFHEGNDDPEYLARRLFHQYLGSFDLSAEKLGAMSRMFTDSLFKSVQISMLEYHMRDQAFGRKVFAYEFAHEGDRGLIEVVLGIPPDNSTYVAHGDDLLYQFEFLGTNSSLVDPEDLFVSGIMAKLWTNFAKTGDPTPDLSLGFKWNQVSPNDLSHLIITSAPVMTPWDTTQMKQFWMNLPTLSNKLLYPDRFQPMMS